MPGFAVVGIGEIVWDLLPGGPQLGGAPANFAYHAHALGASAAVISRVGRDELGRRAIDDLRRRGLAVDAIQIDEDASTGVVDVALDERGGPRFTIREHAAWDRLAADPVALDAVGRATAVCFGTLAQRQPESRATIRQLVSAVSPAALRVLDLNLRPPFDAPDVIADSLALANVLKLNEQELDRLSELFGIGGDLRERLSALAARHDLRAAACTRGERGSVLLAEGLWSEHPGVAATVADTVGAGDAFAAAMTVGLLAGEPLDRINQRANELAAYVVSRAGGMPDGVGARQIGNL